MMLQITCPFEICDKVTLEDDIGINVNKISKASWIKEKAKQKKHFIPV